jgi:nitrogen fixation protein FixH
VAIASVIVLAFVFVAIVLLVVQREHVAAQRANQKCQASAPRDVTGWALRWSADGETFTCTYGRNGRPTGQVFRARRSDL